VISKGPTDSLDTTGKLTVETTTYTRLEGTSGGPLTDRIGVRLAVERDTHSGYPTLYRPIADPVGLGSVKSGAEDQIPGWRD